MADISIEKDGELYVRLPAFFEAAIRPAVMVPFNGTLVPVLIRELTYAQVRACGDFSLIETFSDKVRQKKTQSISQMVDYAEMQYTLLKEALVSPTYDEIVGLTGITVDHEELDRLKGLVKELPIGPKRDKLSKELDTVRMNSEFILPSDFVSYIISYSLNIDKTDIKKVSEEMLFEAAILANNNKNAPSDNLPGLFSDFNKVDINKRAWIIFSQRQKELKENGKRRRG